MTLVPLVGMVDNKNSLLRDAAAGCLSYRTAASGLGERPRWRPFTVLVLPTEPPEEDKRRWVCVLRWSIELMAPMSGWVPSSYRLTSTTTVTIELLGLSWNHHLVVAPDDEVDVFSPRTKDIEITLNVNLEDFYNGTKKKLAVRRKRLVKDPKTNNPLHSLSSWEGKNGYRPTTRKLQKFKKVIQILLERISFLEDLRISEDIKVDPPYLNSAF